MALYSYSLAREAATAGSLAIPLVQALTEGSPVAIYGFPAAFTDTAIPKGSIAANVVRSGTPCAFFTLEMSKQEVTQRLMCSEAKVESQRLRSGKLAVDDWPRLTAACDKLAKAPIYVDDTGSITMMEIRSKARRSSFAARRSR